jgi:hypothetical protein
MGCIREAPASIRDALNAVDDGVPYPISHRWKTGKWSEKKLLFLIELWDRNMIKGTQKRRN